jgi:hypothetical protein
MTSRNPSFCEASGGQAELSIRAGHGSVGWVSARSATRPMPIGFGEFQPTVNSNFSIPVGYSGRTGRGFLGRLVGRVGYLWGWKHIRSVKKKRRRKEQPIIKLSRD